MSIPVLRMNSKDFAANAEAKSILKAVIDNAAAEAAIFSEEDNANLAVQLILSDSLSRQALLAFMVSERSEENVLFFEEVERLNDSEDFEKDADAVIAEFVQIGSPMEINVSQAMRRRIIAARSEGKPEEELLHLLQLAQEEVLKIIMGVFARFQRSKYYEDWSKIEFICEQGGTEASQPSDSDYLLILLVEDSMPVIKIMSRALFNKGYSVEVAKDGKDALQKIMTKRYYAALIDFNIPVMSGPEVVSKYRANEALSMAQHITHRRLPIIGMSALTDKDMQRAGTEAGMDAFLRKPFDVQRFIELVDKQNLLNAIAVRRSAKSLSARANYRGDGRGRQRHGSVSKQTALK